MRAFAWVCIVAGVLLAVASFFITATTPSVNPWPSFGAGICITALGIVMLAIEKNLKP
jgi:hypothetical protein